MLVRDLRPTLLTGFGGAEDQYISRHWGKEWASLTFQRVQIVGSIEDKNAGPSYSVVRLAEALAARGGRSVLMSLADTVGECVSGGVQYQRFRTDPGPIPLPGQLLPSRMLAQAVSAAAAEGALLHVHGLWRMPNVYPGLTAKRTGTPLVVSPRGMLGPAALQFSKLQKQVFWQLFQKRALQRVTCFHATAQSEVEDIRTFGLTAPVAVIPNGIDVADTARTAARPDGPRQVLHLGRIHPKKGIDRLLRAWALLERLSDGWELRIVGPSEGGHAEVLERLAGELGLANVRFEAPLHGAAKAAAYAGAELFVLPTLHENFGMVVAEALAQGTPVISTVGAPWQRLVTERCGWWVEHGPDPLAAALREAMALSDGARAHMGARGRDWMRRDYSWTSIADRMDRLYRWCGGDGELPEFVVT